MDEVNKMLSNYGLSGVSTGATIPEKPITEMEDINGRYERLDVTAAQQVKSVDYDVSICVNIKIKHYDDESNEEEVETLVKEGDIVEIIYVDVTQGNELVRIIGLLSDITFYHYENGIRSSVGASRSTDRMYGLDESKTPILVIDYSDKFKSQTVSILADYIRAIQVMEKPCEPCPPILIVTEINDNVTVTECIPNKCED